VAYGYKSVLVDPAGPDGYKRLAIDEATAPVARRIFELFADGWGERRIAAQLDVEGVPSPGARWKRSRRRADGKWLQSAVRTLILTGLASSSPRIAFPSAS
jgi:hypothetical protein